MVYAYMNPRDEERLLRQARQRRAEFQGLVNTADEGVARRAAEIAVRNPNSSPGVVSATAQEGLPDEEVDRIAGLEGGGGIIGEAADFVTDVGSAIYEQGIKPLIRGTFTLADTLSQELVQRPLTAALTAGEAGGFGEAYDAYGDSAGLNLLQGDLDESAEGGALGTGFFSGGQAQARSEQERTLTVDGNQATLGRALPSTRFTGELFGFDSTAYNAVAGVSQFAVDVLADPLALALGGSTTLGRAAARTGMLADGSTAQRAVRGGAMGLRRDARRLDASKAKEILDDFELRGLPEVDEKIATLRSRLAEFDDEFEGLPKRALEGEELERSNRLYNDMNELEGEIQSLERQRAGLAQGDPEAPDAVIREVKEGIGDYGDYSMDPSKPAIFNMYNYLGRGEPPIVPGVRGELSARLDELDERNIGDVIGRAMDEAADKDDFARWANEAKRDENVAEYLAVVHEATVETLSQQVRKGNTVLLDEWTREGGQVYRKLSEEDLFGLDPNDLVGFTDDIIVVPKGQLADFALDVAPPPSTHDQLMGASGALKANGRNTVLVEKASDLIGRREILGELANSDAYTIWQSWKKSAANYVDTKTIRALGNATDETEASAILLDAIQQGKVTEKGFYSGLTGVRRRAANSRLAGMSPRGMVHVEDIPDAVDKLDSYMRQAGVGQDARASYFSKMLDVEAAPAEEQTELFFQVSRDIMEEVTRSLDGDVEAILDAVKMMGDDARDLGKYGITRAGDPIPTPMHPKKVDPGTGEEVFSIGPQITSELAKIGFELPNVTAIRRASKRALNQQKIYNSAGWAATSDGLRWATRDLFKPAAILRPAYVVRIGLEEQMRLAAAGYDSLFTHPFRFIQANVLARKSDLSLNGDGLNDVGDALGVINERAYNVMNDPASGMSRVFDTITKPLSGPGDTRYIRAWQHELAQLSAASEARWMARNGGDIEGFLDWARNTPDGRKAIERLSRSSKDGAVMRTSDEAVRELGASINIRMAAKAGGDVSDDGRIVRSLGDADLLDAISTGRFSGIPLSAQATSPNVSANIHRLLRSKFDIAPQNLKIERTPGKGEAAERAGSMRKAVDYLFDNLTGKPTNSLARYPAFRQSYVKRAGESMSALADDATRMAFARQIDEALTLTKAEKQDLASAVARASGKKGFHDDLLELDEVVKVKAASEVKDLLFDVTNRSNIQDTYETALPFFDAWLEVTRTWGRLTKENPAFFMKAMQGYQSLRNSGVVYANDFGEEVFAYPGGGMLSKFFGNEDASMRLEGRVQGANLVAQGVGPGFGPMVQWGVGALMPSTREWQDVREFVAPFGTGGVESAGDLADPGKLVESFVPAWARKGLNAVSGGGIDKVQWNATTGDVMKVLAESGNYDPSDVSSRQKLIDDAKRGGMWVLLLRSFTQAVGVTGASAAWELDTEMNESAIPTDWDPETDPDGRWHTIGTLQSELFRLAEFYDYDWTQATNSFVQMYGVEPHYVTQAKSRSLTESPVTSEGDFWMQENEDFVDRHRAVAGYFAPPEEDTDLDYSVYRRQFESGDRQSYTAEQQFALANQTKARSMYQAAKTQLEANPQVTSSQRTAALSQIRGMIEEEYPGWQSPVIGVGEKLTNQEKISALREAVQDESSDASPVTDPLMVYFAARDQVLAINQERFGPSATLGRAGAADLRDALAQVGLDLASQYPAFRGLWSQVLARETEDS